MHEEPPLFAVLARLTSRRVRAPALPPAFINVAAPSLLPTQLGSVEVNGGNPRFSLWLEEESLDATRRVLRIRQHLGTPVKISPRAIALTSVTAASLSGLSAPVDVIAPPFDELHLPLPVEPLRHRPVTMQWRCTEWFGAVLDWWEVVEDGRRQRWGNGLAPEVPDFEVEMPFPIYLDIRSGVLSVREFPGISGCMFVGDVDALLFFSGLCAERQRRHPIDAPPDVALACSDALTVAGPAMRAAEGRVEWSDDPARRAGTNAYLVAIETPVAWRYYAELSGPQEDADLPGFWTWASLDLDDITRWVAQGALDASVIVVWLEAPAQRLAVPAGALAATLGALVDKGAA